MIQRVTLITQEERFIGDLVAVAVRQRMIHRLLELRVEMSNGVVLLDGTARRYYHVQLAFAAARRALRANGLDHIPIDLRLRVVE